mgnify:CR=1 FL=1
MKILDEQEVSRVVNLTTKHEKKWLQEYTREIRSGELWDTNFIDYKCFRVFIKEYKSDIKLYMHEYYKETVKLDCSQKSRRKFSSLFSSTLIGHNFALRRIFFARFFFTTSTH